MKSRNCLVLSQYRDGDEFNDFVGKYYHFPVNAKKNYLKQFDSLPIEFLYYEPEKKGEGVFFGYGRIENLPFQDNRDKDFYFVEIAEFKRFATPVFFKNPDGEIKEKTFNPETYNSNNAVRKISSIFLDEICSEGGIILNFKADAHLIKILGEQLIGSEKVGILELVKNAIDASASYCRVRLEKIPSLPDIRNSSYEFDEFEGPVIVVEDDGRGMTREVIENGWLRPASTIKTNVKEKLRLERERAEKEGKLGAYNNLIKSLEKEHGGRIPLGEKGVGRFATHRLGKKLLMKTKTQDMDYEYVLSIDWDDFDNHGKDSLDLDAVGIVLKRQPPSRNYGIKNSGTQLIISGGRPGFILSEKTIETINRSLLRLNSPNPNPNKITTSFKAFTECPQLENLLNEEIYSSFDPNFSLDAIINEHGVIEEYSLEFSPPKSVPLPKEKWSDKNYDLKLATPEYWIDKNGKTRSPSCGSFFIHIDAWYRKKPWLDGPDFNEMTKYLDEFGGMSVYRDNVIIFPAESGTKNDWLNLSKRHIKQGYRISYYNFIGNIEINQTENLEIIDAANRETILENVAFLDLAKLSETIIQNILEIKYIAKRDEYTNLTKGIVRDPKKLLDAAKNGSIIIEGVKNNYPIDSDPWEILHRLGKTADEKKGGLVNLESSLKNLKKSIEIIEGVQEKLTEHAGFGIAAAVSLHELTKITTNFYHGISILIENDRFDKIKLEDLKSASASLKSELKRLSPLRAIRNENRREFNISKSINYATEIFSRKLQKCGIELEISINEDFPLYARYSTLNQIFANLFDNSLYWLPSNNSAQGKKIHIEINSKYRTVIFADTGPGIDQIIRPYLFEAGYSMKIPPSGLGLYICKTYMHSMKGDIHETTSRERIKGFSGAQFTLEFENVPRSKEEEKQ